VGGSERRRPKYAAIAEDLDAKIKSGAYRPGQPLPPQRELSATYGVTLMTLRQALQLLTERGLVSQQAGRGTFVAAPKASYSLGSMQSLADDLRGQGHLVETALLGRDLLNQLVLRVDGPAQAITVVQRSKRTRP